MPHWSAHVYIDKNRFVAIEIIDKKLDKIVLSWELNEFKEKISTSLKNCFYNKNPFKQKSKH